MTSRQATVKNDYGIHCRPSAVIVKESQHYEAAIEISLADGRQADAKNMFGVIGLAVRQGETVTIAVDGPDEQAVCERMVTLFETNFDFPR